jgi:hypothetical protein
MYLAINVLPANDVVELPFMVGVLNLRDVARSYGALEDVVTLALGRAWSKAVPRWRAAELVVIIIAIEVAVVNLGVDIVNEVGSAARSNRGVLILSLNQVDNRDWMMGVEVLASFCDASLDIAGIYRRIWDAH